MMLTDECLRDLEWWYKNVDSWNCHFLSNQQISLQMFTDASDSGWGGGTSLNGHTSFGLWDQETARQSINYRELSAVLLALQFSPSLADNDQQLRHSCQYQSLRRTKLRSHKLDTVLVGLRPHSQGNFNSFTPSWHREQKGPFIISYEQSPRVALKQKHFGLLERARDPHTIERCATWANRQLQQSLLRSSNCSHRLPDGSDPLILPLKCRPRPLSESAITGLLNECIARAGLDSKQYSATFFRPTGATHAIRAGFSPLAVMKAGRFKKEERVSKYLCSRSSQYVVLSRS